MPDSQIVHGGPTPRMSSLGSGPAHAACVPRHLPYVRYVVSPQDEEYQAAGAKLVDHASSFKADIVLKIRPPTVQEADLLNERSK